MGTVERKKVSRGFTFIEVCIVVLVFSIVISAVYGVFKSGLSICRRVREFSFKEERIVLALERLTQQVKQIIAFSEEELEFQGKSNELVFVGFDNISQGFMRYEYKFDKKKKKLILSTQTIDDALEGKGKKKRELVSLNKFSFIYFGSDPETGEIFETDEWESEDLPIEIKVQATEYFPSTRSSKLGHVYVASGNKKRTISYEKEVSLEKDIRTIVRRVFLPVTRHLRP